jgi:hypothetical protein
MDLVMGRGSKNVEKGRREVAGGGGAHYTLGFLCCYYKRLSWVETSASSFS